MTCLLNLVPEKLIRIMEHSKLYEGKKLSLVIPYRNRKNHLKKFLEIHNRKIPIPHSIFVIEQTKGKLFNTGKLKNIGFELSKNTHDYVCFQDVDKLPIHADYSYPIFPTCIARYVEQYGWEMASEDYFGGVVIFNNRDFQRVNGYSNEYWGWGSEDHDLRNRCTCLGLKYLYRQGVFRSLHHKPTAYFNNPNLYNNHKKLISSYDYTKDGLNSLQYKIVKVTKLSKNIKIIKVDI